MSCLCYKVSQSWSKGLASFHDLLNWYPSLACCLTRFSNCADSEDRVFSVALDCATYLRLGHLPHLPRHLHQVLSTVSLFSSEVLLDDRVWLGSLLDLYLPVCLAHFRHFQEIYRHFYVLGTFLWTRHNSLWFAQAQHITRPCALTPFSIHYRLLWLVLRLLDVSFTVATYQESSSSALFLSKLTRRLATVTWLLLRDMVMLVNFSVNLEWSC